MIEAALKNATIIPPAGAVPPPARHEQAMLVAIDGMLAESRRSAAAAGRPIRRGGTLH